jgi:hypothetical protein
VPSIDFEMELKTIKQSNILGEGVPALLFTIDVPNDCLDGMMMTISNIMGEESDKLHDLQYALCFKAILMGSDYGSMVSNDAMQ